jgi:MFS family permease
MTMVPDRTSPPRAPRVHYGWVIVAAGTLTTFSALGLGRFALGMLLPSMGAGLGLDYHRMGVVGTANFLGYLLAVLTSGILVARTGARALVAGSLLLVGATMVAVSRASSYPAVLALYFLTGVGSGAANVPMMSLVAAWFGPRLRGRAAGFIVIGSGFAILLSGWLVPALNRAHGANGWRAGWLTLGLIVLAAAAVNAAALRNRPADRGLEPVGGGAAPFAPPAHHPRGIRAVLANGRLRHLALLYFLFGASYVVYATFVVTALVRERGFPESVAGTVWSSIGALSLLSGPVFGALSDRVGRRIGLAVVFLIQCASYALFATGLPGAALAASVVCFGLTAWSIPSIMAAVTADLAGPGGAAAAFGFVTFIFGLGQIAGPVAAGAIADARGSLAAAFGLAAALAGLAALLSLRLPKPAAGRK